MVAAIAADMEVADIVVDMEVDMVPDMEADMVPDMEVDMVADVMADMVAAKFFLSWALLRPNIFKPKLTPACASS